MVSLECIQLNLLPSAQFLLLFYLVKHFNEQFSPPSSCHYFQFRKLFLLVSRLFCSQQASNLQTQNDGPCKTFDYTGFSSKCQVAACSLLASFQQIQTEYYSAHISLFSTLPSSTIKVCPKLFCFTTENGSPKGRAHWC
jgi:hypothetical protein